MTSAVRPSAASRKGGQPISTPSVLVAYFNYKTGSMEKFRSDLPIRGKGEWREEGEGERQVLTWKYVESNQISFDNKNKRVIVKAASPMTMAYFTKMLQFVPGVETSTHSNSDAGAIKGKSDDVESSEGARSRSTRYVAAQAFVAEADNEMSVVAGQTVDVVKADTTGWTYARSTDGRTGWLPSSVLKQE